MTHDEVKAKTLSLLTAHGVHDWKVIVIGGMFSMLGETCDAATRFELKEIIINAAMADDEIMDTVTHEVAHVLTPGDGHGPRWLAKMIELGCSHANIEAAIQVYNLDRPGTGWQELARKKLIKE